MAAVTFSVQVALSSGFDIDVSWLRLDDPVAGLLDQQLLADDDVMADLSADANGFSRVMAFQIDRSSTQGAGALVEYATGTLTLVLRDDVGDLDPETLGNMIPGSRIVFAKQWAGEVYPLFTGTVDSYLPEHRYPDQAVVVITASDMLASVARHNRNAQTEVGAGDDTGARIDRVLTSIGWPEGLRDIDTGLSTLTATTLEGSALDEARRAARAEVGELWADPAGRIRFRNRHALFLEARSTTVQATFGSGPGELPFAGRLGLSYDRDRLVNVVRARRDDDAATIYEVGDSASRFRFGDHAHEQTDLALDTDSDVQNWASYVLSRDAFPQLRFTSLTVDVRADPDALYPQVLAREFGDRIAAVRRPPGVAADTREVYVRGIHHDFQAPDQWRTSYELEPAESGEAFFLDDPVQGLLDQNVLVY